MFREWGLYVQNHFISSAVGEADYHEDNDRQTFATAAESVKSNALMRCCKDLGIASECWDKRWAEAYRRDYCIKVTVQTRNGKKEQWRRRDAEPFDGEVKPPTVTTERTQAQTTEKAQDARPVEQRQEVIDVKATSASSSTPAPSTAVAKVYFPSDVFAAGNAKQWKTKDLQAFIQEHFNKSIAQLEKGDECEKAVKAVQQA